MNINDKANQNPHILKAIEMFGSQQKFGDEIGVTQGTVTGWLNNQHGINPFNAKKIEEKTNGQVKAIDICPKIVELL